MLDAFICPSTFTFQFLCPVLQPGALISMYCIHRLPSEKQHQEARIRKERKTRIFNPGHPPIHSSSSSLEPRVYGNCRLLFKSEAPCGRPSSTAKGMVMVASLSIVPRWVPPTDCYSLHLPPLSRPSVSCSNLDHSNLYENTLYLRQENETKLS